MSSIKRPRVMVDIRGEKSNPYQLKEERINLKKTKVNRINLSFFFKRAVLVMACFWLIFGFVYAPTANTLFAAPDVSEREILEEQLADLERQIAEYESTIDQYRRQGSTLKSEIGRIEAEISRLQLQIRATNLSLSQLSNQIQATSSQISETENAIINHRDNLAEILRDIYEKESKGMVEILLRNPNLSDFFQDVNAVMLVQDNLRATLQRVIALRVDLIDQRENLALERRDAEALAEYQASQRAAVARTQEEKNELLRITQGEESKYQELLTETKQTAAEIRSRIFRLLGGGELTFEIAYDLAKHTEQSTGIRAALILAVLDQESALGRNVGQCRYNINPYYPARASNITTMHPTRDIPHFLTITAELGLDPEQTPVSCPIPRDGAYGGAMGPAQFIPSTWNMYKPEIAAATGNNPPSPWRNLDAFTATGLYLKDSYFSNTCRNYASQIPSQARMLQERCAAAQYYAGGNWYNYRFIYGDPVVQRAERFQADIDILEGR